ncbi:hypothetical protein PR048_020912 [Dryococelus australis]|uniref:BESS domain-containing protein n=1 Tax=Dryococelus australis TaxID=614101 RepID=A0ABQ9GWR4_9NEOP|nr:hypothetical protein PR048_020912 [Dryococelus australis]
MHDQCVLEVHAISGTNQVVKYTAAFDNDNDQWKFNIDWSVKYSPLIRKNSKRAFHERNVPVYGLMTKSDREKASSPNKVYGITGPVVPGWHCPLGSRQGASAARRDIYARQLSFLLKTVEPGVTETCVDDDEAEESLQTADETSSASDDLSSTAKYAACPSASNGPACKRHRVLQDHLVSFMKTPVPTPTPELLDYDQYVFDSLLPAVKTLPLDSKLEFRCKVLKSMKMFRAENECSQNRATQNLEQCEPTNHLPHVYGQLQQPYIANHATCALPTGFSILTLLAIESSMNAVQYRMAEYTFPENNDMLFYGKVQSNGRASQRLYQEPFPLIHFFRIRTMAD